MKTATRKLTYRYAPTARQIRVATARIRKAWSVEDHRMRAGGSQNYRRIKVEY